VSREICSIKFLSTYEFFFYVDEMELFLPDWGFAGMPENLERSDQVVCETNSLKLNVGNV
jgi:hypothetical protein